MEILTIHFILVLIRIYRNYSKIVQREILFEIINSIIETNPDKSKFDYLIYEFQLYEPNVRSKIV